MRKISSRSLAPRYLWIIACSCGTRCIPIVFWIGAGGRDAHGEQAKMLESKSYQKLADMIRMEFPDIGERRAERIVEIINEWMESIHDEIAQEEENRQSLSRAYRV